MAQTNKWHTSLPIWGYQHGPQVIVDLHSTIGANFSLRGGFSAVQLILANPAPFPQTVQELFVATSASNAPPHLPRGRDGAPMPWLPVTLGGVPHLTLPPALAADTPSLTLSDIIPLAALPHSTTGEDGLLLTQMHVEAGTRHHGPLIREEQLAALREDIGDATPFFYTTGPALPHAVPEPPPYTTAHIPGSLVVGVRYLTASPVTTLMTLGDSLSCGLGTRSGFTNFGALAASSLSAKGHPVSFIAHGTPAQTTLGSVAAAGQLLALTTPDIVTFTIDSPNNYTGLTENIDHHRRVHEAALSDLMARVIATGTHVVLLTPIPFALYDVRETYGQQRLDAAASARAMQSAHISVLDAQTMLNNGEVFGSLPDDLRGVDDTHLNEAGHYRLSAALEALIAAQWMRRESHIPTG